ncbi:class II aldolase/adducin family protein [Companilactobacillus allii]|uniref:Aldolase n=1 Tax=Companilactobacillus allii TaxID=1847728 RepID=A0A1P8Q128_9LACO|nr:class II aldolase/adducin family protein [Companilactobacillus allii]APX71531.1 aldolase [Companilactobacillus allii]USQ68613.1 class II aldolase/adducin family protein [Companilactobacillus allii]
MRNLGRMMFELEREDMAKVVKTIFDRFDTNVAGGNFSFKVTDKDGDYGDKDKEYIIMTPTMMSEAYLGDLSPAQILVVEPHTRKILDGVGNLTREINMHEAIYDTNPDIKSVFHSHAKEQLAWATMGVPIPNLTEATQKVKGVEPLPFKENCSEELAELVSKHIANIGDAALMHEYLLNSHGVLITVGGKDMSGMTAIHKAVSVVDTMEFNAHIAMEQTKLIKDGALDGYYSKGIKIGTLDDVFNKKIALFNHKSNSELETINQ